MHPSASGILEAVFTNLVQINDGIIRTNERHKRSHMEHLVNSRREIITTADLAISRTRFDKPKKALILGAGSCFDIPLEGLAERFDELTLVDLDPGKTARAIRNLSPSLQQKYTL